MRVVIDVIDAVRVEQARPAHDAVHLVALGEQKLGQIRAVLPGDAGDQSPLLHVFSLTSTTIRRVPASSTAIADYEGTGTVSLLSASREKTFGPTGRSDLPSRKR